MPVIRPSDHHIETVEQGGHTPRNTPPNMERWLTEPGRLTQFGAFIQILQPGTRSSLLHWHSSEDELVYVLDGELTVLEGGTRATLRAGDAAAFKAGDPVGHCLINESDQPVKLMVVGTRSPVDRITYPEHDRLLIRDRSQPEDVWTDLAGHPASSPY